MVKEEAVVVRAGACSRRQRQYHVLTHMLKKRRVLQDMPVITVGVSGGGTQYKPTGSESASERYSWLFTSAHYYCSGL